MVHPIFQANENSPYGDLTREEFYKEHQIHHQQSFMLNQRKMRIFTQSWTPISTLPLKGLVAMIHGFGSESSWLFELNAVAIAQSGYHVCALDLQGHGYSDGLTGHIPHIKHVVNDCIQFFDSARASHPNLPAFLYGESLGGAIAILVCLKQGHVWNGVVLCGAMCGVSAKVKPMWPLEKLLPVAAFVAPKWKIVITKSPAGKSYKEGWKRKLVVKSPNRPKCGKPTAATALEFLRVCCYIKRNCFKLEVPMLVLHGGEDRVCDLQSARFVYESANIKDKSMKIYPGMWHQFIGEPNENVEMVIDTVLYWVGERAEKAKAKKKIMCLEM